MAGMSLLLALGAAAGTLVTSHPSRPWLDPCTTARLVARWMRQDYVRTPVIADPPARPYGHHVRYIGDVHTVGRAYRIYFDVNDDPKTRHGNSDVVVTTANGRFLGVYDVDATPERTERADIYFESRKDYGNRIHFGRHGLPKHIWVNGEATEFTPAADFGPAPWPPPKVARYCRR